MAATTAATARTHPIPTAATLAHLFAALRAYEPDLADSIANYYIALTPTHHPLLLLNSKQFQRLQAAVQALPRGWRHGLPGARHPTVAQRINTIVQHIPRNLLTIVPQIITPQPHNRIRVEYRHSTDSLAKVPAGLHGIFHSWDVYDCCANPAHSPLTNPARRYADHEYRHTPLTHRTLIKYWDNRPRNTKNYIQLFDSSFPADVGRLLYAVATYYALGEDKTAAQFHPGRRHRIIGEHCREYNRIKKAHVSESPRHAKGQLVADRKWLALLGPAR
jgi:hypothetical protein